MATVRIITAGYCTDSRRATFASEFWEGWSANRTFGVVATISGAITVTEAHKVRLGKLRVR
jgi:hypothetical protein